ncbi:MAG TPA: hypothetical protein VFY39_05885, partial [Gammaproteobacteria bacterium]|nr:hypothetical protein [Gammaproteobacteria bacterium]
GTLRPEFESLRIPKPLTQEQAAGMDLRLYTGLYASARRAVLIHRRGERLALRACTLDAKPLPREESVEARLRPSEKQIFFTDPPAGQGFPFVQFVSPYRGGFRHVWNGRFLLRKLSC